MSNLVEAPEQPGRREPNMPSLQRVLAVLRTPAGPTLCSGMDATPRGSVRITGTPMMGEGYPACECGRPLGHDGGCNPK